MPCKVQRLVKKLEFFLRINPLTANRFFFRRILESWISFLDRRFVSFPNMFSVEFLWCKTRVRTFSLDIFRLRFFGGFRLQLVHFSFMIMSRIMYTFSQTQYDSNFENLFYFLSLQKFGFWPN